MASIDKESQIVTITAVPRGTYSPLPPGKGTTSSDYYVSNACDLGGLEYGINQIEKILRQKADYLVLVGFSETLGILRNLKLPATETLQWLRHRQSYQIGEPQRAHNHSTFLKQMLIEHIPKNNSTLDSALQYLIYSRLKTDLSFAQVKIIINTLSEMNLSENPDKIILSMNPPYPVQDIEYDQDNLANFLQSRIEPIKHLLSKDDFSGMDSASAQNKLIDLIEQNIDDDDFAIWAYENYLWLQIENTEILLAKQYDLMKKYVSLIDEKTKRQALIADYILEMEYFDEKDYIEKGKKLLQSELGY
jgi:anionic cell wall polymer biosynthesis LytR-Cps2A-Psr (LCP) family protein